MILDEVSCHSYSFDVVNINEINSKIFNELPVTIVTSYVITCVSIQGTFFLHWDQFLNIFDRMEFSDFGIPEFDVVTPSCHETC